MLASSHNDIHDGYGYPTSGFAQLVISAVQWFVVKEGEIDLAADKTKPVEAGGKGNPHSRNSVSPPSMLQKFCPQAEIGAGVCLK